jgi:hypothetical protein
VYTNPYTSIPQTSDHAEKDSNALAYFGVVSTTMTTKSVMILAPGDDRFRRLALALVADGRHVDDVRSVRGQVLQLFVSTLKTSLLRQ